MHLSELEIIVKYLQENAAGAYVNNIYRSHDGTLIKLYGCSVISIFFSERARQFFPADDMANFPRQDIGGLEEGLRKHIKDKRIHSIEILKDFGKVVRLTFSDRFLVIPLFGGKSPYIIDAAGELIWSLKKEWMLEKIDDGALKFVEPVINDPLEFEKAFLAEIIKKNEERRQKQIREKKAFLERKLEKIRQELKKNTEKAAEFMENAQLLKANIYTLKMDSKAGEAEVYGYDGAIKKIELDNSLTILNNMEKFFVKGKRHKRGIDSSRRLVLEIENEISGLEELFTESKPQEKKSRAEKKAESVHKHYMTYTSARGRVFLVGKSARDNDELTFKTASPHDIFFHAKDYSGSHVILRKTKSEEPPDEDVILACSLALFYSHARKGGEGEVWFAERKFVTKKKGMAPGMVLITRGKCRHIRLERDFFESLKKEE